MRYIAELTKWNGEKETIKIKKEWIDDIVKQCDEAKIRVFMKESLRDIMGKDFRQDKLIWDVNDG